MYGCITHTEIKSIDKKIEKKCDISYLEVRYYSPWPVCQHLDSYCQQNCSLERSLWYTSQNWNVCLKISHFNIFKGPGEFYPIFYMYSITRSHWIYISTEASHFIPYPRLCAQLYLPPNCCFAFNLPFLNPSCSQGNCVPSQTQIWPQHSPTSDQTP